MINHRNEVVAGLVQHLRWLRVSGEAFELKKDYRRHELGRRFIVGVDVDLSGFDFSGAELSTASLGLGIFKAAKFVGANLAEADFSGAICDGADFSGANMHSVVLSAAGFVGANFSGANLSYANCARGDFAKSKFVGANLSQMQMRDADFTDADFTGTCLDPKLELPPIPNELIFAAGLEPRLVDGVDYVYGYRTSTCKIINSLTQYKPGTTHVAPWFSTDQSMDCHPGIYLAGKGWLLDRYNPVDLVRCRCLRKDLLNACTKWRCRRLEILPAREQIYHY